MIILAIDTSCDDTCVSNVKCLPRTETKFLVRGQMLNVKSVKFEVLSNVVSSQVEVHKKWGGVYPTLAKREHQKNLVPVLERAMREAGMLKKSKIQMSNAKSNPKSKCQNLEKILKREQDLLKDLTKFLKKYKKPNIDAIAVTVGPGLEPCLWTGVNFAKALSYCWDLLIVPVNHIEAHILANLLPQIGSNSKPKTQNLKKIEFPAICLVASGGHTQLILMEDIGKYKILGETRDDAAGECLDKVARILGLGYPGGQAIAALAKMEIQNPKSQIQNKSKITNSKFKINLPRPMIHSQDYDFSFSGLKTAVLYDYQKRPQKIKKSKQYIQAMCAEVQQAIIDVLIKKTIKAARDYKARTIILGGGVAANEELRKQFNSKVQTLNSKLKILVPPKIFCTDNAAMVAITAYFHRKNTKPWKAIKVDANLRIS